MISKKGFAYFFAILFGLLILEFAYCVKIFKDRGAHLVDYESESYIAYMVAESGLNCAIEEIKANFEWKTDDITNDSDNNLIFTSTGEAPNCIIKGSSGNDFSVSFKNGTYQGNMKIVEKDDSLFKVKAGMLETQDNPNTSNLDESKIFYMIRSYGKFGDQYKGIDTIVEIAYANRFIIFDGQDALISYGSSSSDGEDTYIADGDIYGRNHVLLGVPNGSNTRLYLKNIKNITTGKNGYMCFQQTGISDISIYKGSTEVKLETGDFNLVNTKVKEIEAGEDASVEDKKIKTFGGILKDKYTGGRDFDVDYNNLKSFYRSLAEGDFTGHGSGIVITRDSSDVVLKEYNRNKYVNETTSYGPTFADCDGKADDKYEVMMIDFGDLMLGDMDVSDDFGDPEDNKIPESLKPVSSSNFNGIIYSEVPLVIWGNPDRDLIIYSEWDIYIAGDFNQRKTISNMTLTGGDNAGPVKQDYLTENGLKYVEYDDYVEENALWRESNPDYNQGVYWNNIDVIAETRVWYDFSDPKKSLKNELIPFIQYEIYKRLFLGIDGTDLSDITLDTDETYIIGSGNTIIEEAREKACVLNSAAGIYEFDENTGFTVTTSDGSIKTCLIDILFSSDISEISGAESVFGNNPGTLKDYFMNTLYFGEDTAETIINDIIGLIKDIESGDVVQKVTREEVKNYIEENIWPYITDKAFIYSILKSDGQEKDGIVNRLYKTVNFKDGVFKQGFSAGGSYADDLLYVPECSINAKRISMGILVPNIGLTQGPGTTNRWDCDVSKIDNIKSSSDYGALDEIKKVNTIRPVLGNSYNTSTSDMYASGTAQLKEEGVEAEIEDGYYRYMTNDQMFLRTHGSELYLRNMKDIDRLPYIRGGYGPHIRKKIFDPHNRSKYEPRSYNVVDVNYYSISQEMFEDFK